MSDDLLAEVEAGFARRKAARAELLDERRKADAASRRGRRSRAKGKRFERVVATLLRGLYGDGVRRGWQARSGKDDCDVVGTPFHVECKSGKQVNLRAALRQAIADTDGRPPVVIARDDRQEPVVVMRLKDWLDAMRERKELADAIDREFGVQGGGE